jgi:hypothetical protein
VPTIKKIEKKHSQKNRQGTESANEATNTSKSGKRRPGRDDVISSPEVKVVEVEVTENQTENQDQAQQASQQTATEPAQAETVPHKIEINFPGSELIRAKFPLPFDLAESVATDWLNDGKFEDLPVNHPLAKTFAQQGLLKAKEIEKKVMASPVTEKVTMQAFTYAVKAQSFIKEMKAKVQTKK